MSESELNISELKKVRLEKLAELKEMGIEPFGRRFERDSMAQNIKEAFSELEGKTIAIAGRIMSKRRHGKAGKEIQRITQW